MARNATEVDGTAPLFAMSSRCGLKCFVSHAYADEPVVDALLTFLPSTVKPVIWPAKAVSADQMVSQGIVGEIRSCDLLIYLRGGRSSKSPWVAFERDYALRNGLRVYAFDPVLGLTEDHSSPLDLRVFTVYGGADRDAVLRITRFLRDKRSFDLFVRHEQQLQDDTWQSTIHSASQDALKQHGFAVWFVSRKGLGSLSARWIVSLLCEGDHVDRLLPVKLDHIDLRDVAHQWNLPNGDTLEATAFDLSKGASLALTARFRSLISRLPFRINQNTLDDLIVHIYHGIYHSTSSVGRALHESLS